MYIHTKSHNCQNFTQHTRIKAINQAGMHKNYFDEIEGFSLGILVLFFIDEMSEKYTFSKRTLFQSLKMVLPLFSRSRMLPKLLFFKLAFFEEKGVSQRLK